MTVTFNDNENTVLIKLLISDLSKMSYKKLVIEADLINPYLIS